MMRCVIKCGQTEQIQIVASIWFLIWNCNFCGLTLFPSTNYVSMCKCTKQMYLSDIKILYSYANAFLGFGSMTPVAYLPIVSKSELVTDFRLPG